MIGKAGKLQKLGDPKTGVAQHKGGIRPGRAAGGELGEFG